METLKNALRELIGNPPSIITNGTEVLTDYGELIEYVGCLMLVLIVVGSIFKLLVHFSSR